MKYCKYCGKQIDDNESVCPYCDKNLSVSSHFESGNPKPTSNKTISKVVLKYRRIIVIGVIVLAVISVSVIVIAGAGKKCKATGCENKAIRGFNYCYNHKCSVPTCPEKCKPYSNYCSDHASIYDDEDDYTYDNHKVSSYDLWISDIKITSNSSYTIAEGTIYNNGDYRVSFVQIKGSFKDRLGYVIDTDWTYAVGAEGLAPGESSKWRMSVSKDRTITNCDVTILDYED